MFVTSRVLAVAALAVAGAGSAAASDTFINATVGGVLAPGVYGRIDIGSAPPPPVLYQQPVIIGQPVVGVRPRPVYMYVPPGHAKHWGKHCAKYNACGVPVYFANVDNRGHYVRGPRHEEYRHERDRRHDDHRHSFDDRGGRQGFDDDRGHGRGDRGDRGHGHGGGRGHGRD